MIRANAGPRFANETVDEGWVTSRIVARCTRSVSAHLVWSGGTVRLLIAVGSAATSAELQGRIAAAEAVLAAAISLCFWSVTFAVPATVRTRAFGVISTVRTRAERWAVAAAADTDVAGNAASVRGAGVYRNTLDARGNAGTGAEVLAAVARLIAELAFTFDGGVLRAIAQTERHFRVFNLGEQFAADKVICFVWRETVAVRVRAAARRAGGAVEQEAELALRSADSGGARWKRVDTRDARDAGGAVDGHVVNGVQTQAETVERGSAGWRTRDGCARETLVGGERRSASTGRTSGGQRRIWSGRTIVVWL